MRYPRLFARTLRVQTGQGLTEFALVVPLLMLMVVGLFDLGYAVFTYNMISNAAREGARVAIIRTHTDADIDARIYAAAPGLNLPSCPTCITINPSPNRTFDDPVHVTVTYTYVPMTPLLGQFLGGGLVLSSTSTMVAEGVIEY